MTYLLSRGSAVARQLHALSLKIDAVEGLAALNEVLEDFKATVISALQHLMSGTTASIPSEVFTEGDQIELTPLPPVPTDAKTCFESVLAEWEPGTSETGWKTKAMPHLKKFCTAMHLNIDVHATHKRVYLNLSVRSCWYSAGARCVSCFHPDVCRCLYALSFAW